MQTNRVCKTCGKEYFYCSHCDKTVNTPQWMLMWHDENCKNIFEIVSSFAQGQISKDEAYEKLEKCDLTKLYSFKENIRLIIEDILNNRNIKSTKSVLPDVEENVVEETPKRTVPKRNRSNKRR